MFIDEARVILKAGDGGDGCLSFLREKYRPDGGPNGGDGGRGGDIILLCDRNVTDLTHYRFSPRAHAGDGGSGRGSNCHGADGAPCFLKVPEGTVVVDGETGAIAVELLANGEAVTLLKGGHGGKGNVNFKSSVNQAPRKVTLGAAGEAGEFTFILKTIADIGLVGFPNAGKSSLMNILTNAGKKSAPYPFTTLSPKVGVITYPEHYGRRTIADIPGLIAGAHENRGLGIKFLRHIERCEALLFLLDAAGVDGRDPLSDYATLLRELGHYDGELLKKRRIIAANKIDLSGAEENLGAFRREAGGEILAISCATGVGIEELKENLRIFTRTMD
ncbi:MAG: Obg family GTPase CgtA [Puniceicoccales bacterium]|jgi:GTP-binding protein|nr:Obg family GTPase CgtA [Puniceicoccales bacterium]